MAATPPSTDLPRLSLQHDDLLLISPTKARQAISTAKSWASVDSRLSALYAPSKVPLFERNDDTLKALLALVQANEAADAEAMILHRARQEELEAFETRYTASLVYQQENEHDALSVVTLLDDLKSSLTLEGRQSLDDVATATVHTGVIDSSGSGLGERIIDLTQSCFRARTYLEQLEALQQNLHSHIAEMQHLLMTRQSQREAEAQHEETLQQERSLWDREVKQLKYRLSEYRERIVGLERHVETISGPKVHEIVAQEKLIQEMEENVEKLISRITGFSGLPPDVEAAKGEIDRAKGELADLVRQREEMVTQLASRG